MYRASAILEELVIAQSNRVESNSSALHRHMLGMIFFMVGRGCVAMIRIQQAVGTVSAELRDISRLIQMKTGEGCDIREDGNMRTKAAVKGDTIDSEGNTSTSFQD